VAKELGVAEAALPYFTPRYNICSTKQVFAAGRNAKGAIAAGWMKWDLVSGCSSRP
jgi:hypothetical protein